MRNFAICLVLLATPLAAQDKTTLCNTSAEIVNSAVLARVEGAKAPAAQKAIVKALDDDKANFEPAVQPLVDWVYTLPDEQLTDEVAKSYVAACMAQ